jgi:hypothetical protein
MDKKNEKYILDIAFLPPDTHRKYKLADFKTAFCISFELVHVEV